MDVERVITGFVHERRGWLRREGAVGGRNTMVFAGRIVEVSRGQSCKVKVLMKFRICDWLNCEQCAEMYDLIGMVQLACCWLGSVDGSERDRLANDVGISLRRG